MPVFDFSFTVGAALARVAGFHHDTRALKQLTPPPIFVQIHRLEPLGNGSVSEFTLWFGPLPIHWVAVHSNVDPRRGFTDTQQQGPLKQWAHTHTFSAISPTETRISEHIEYEHFPGWRGLLSRLLFPTIGLTLLFHYRKWVTRRAVESTK